MSSLNMKTKIYKIKKGKKDKFLAWANKLRTAYRDEVIKSLEEERVEREFVGVFEIEGNDYAIGFVLGENMLPSTQTELNLKHKEVLKDCMEAPINVEIVYDFSASESK